MKAIHYQNFILTIIALCMIIKLTEPATATNNRIQSSMDVNIVSVGGYALYNQKVPVEIK